MMESSLKPTNGEGKKDAKSLKYFPYNEKNPLMDGLIVEKKDTIVGIGKSDVVIDADTGEVKGTSRLIMKKKVDKAMFTKIFESKLRYLLGLSPAALKVATYFMDKLQINSDVAEFDIDECMEKTDYRSKRSIFMGLCELLASGIVARGPSSREYFINPGIMFKGDRLTIIEHYQKVEREEALVEKAKNDKEKRIALEEEIKKSPLNNSKEEQLPGQTEIEYPEQEEPDDMPFK